MIRTNEMMIEGESDYKTKIYRDEDDDIVIEKVNSFGSIRLTDKEAEELAEALQKFTE